MKKLCFLALMLFVLSLPAFAHVRNVGDNFELIYHVLDLNGAHVSAQVVTLEIKKASTGEWFDFGDETFKSSGWISKQITLAENAVDNFYFYDFTPPASETQAEQYQFLVDNASPAYRDHKSLTVTYEDFQSIMDAVDGDREGENYTGIENMIRRHGR